jgi:nicotinate-nucleotide--dimethylbenzimidazole phosphoribosyltransferase
MTRNRPVPLLGDSTSAAERAAEVDGWAFSADAREAFYDIVDARRDVRHYRPDSLDPEVVRRVLTAAHMAPSVGHSQPWRFIMVSDPATKDRAAPTADEQRLRQARHMEADAARRLLDLQLEGIREAPLGLVVACDRRTPGRGVLGRATFPDADLWSCACAIENLSLAARAEGLGAAGQAGQHGAGVLSDLDVRGQLHMIRFHADNPVAVDEHRRPAVQGAGPSRTHAPHGSRTHGHGLPLTTNA